MLEEAKLTRPKPPTPGTQDTRLAIARQVMAECFWGDYLLSAEDILADHHDGGGPKVSRGSGRVTFPAAKLPLGPAGYLTGQRPGFPGPDESELPPI